MTTREKNWNVSPATSSDIEGITKVCQMVEKKDPNFGFITLSYTDHEISARIKDFIVVQDEEHAVVGYVCTKTLYDLKDRTTLQWQSEKLHILFDAAPKRFIEQVAILPDFAKMRAGTSLYTYLFCSNPETWFYTFIMSRPIRNLPANVFHSKMGFRPYGWHCQNNYAGYKDYQATLWVHSPSKK